VALRGLITRSRNPTVCAKKDCETEERDQGPTKGYKAIDELMDE
jgi:hypothetical protein